MAAGNSSPTSQGVFITRRVDAPRSLVWKTWTDCAHVKRWWGPKPFTAPFCRIDLRVGGSYLFCMRSPEGRDFWSTGVYREIVEPERIVFTDMFADANGGVVPASHYGLGGDWAAEIVVTVLFEELENDRTKLTLRQVGIPAGQMTDMTAAGWSTSLDKLAESVAAELKSRG